jgi:hypothetical protein
LKLQGKLQTGEKAGTKKTEWSKLFDLVLTILGLEGILSSGSVFVVQ